jgi:sarcosine oxidase subunit alpha
MFYEPDIAVIGGGPAGLMAALTAAKAGAKVLLMERDGHLGGQLVKQTHKFFGSEKQYASVRGVEIAKTLEEELVSLDDLVDLWTDATAIGLYEDGVLTVDHQGVYKKIRAKRLIAATGASEKFLTFPNNDLPGVYGAGAVQTMMNVQGVKPGRRVLMIGAGNIGLIVSYQLLQAGVEVAAIVEGLPFIGGYAVHASKIRRAGIPILTSHTILEARGDQAVQSAVIAQVDANWQVLPGSEREVDCDVICIAVGLSPLAELLWMAGCDMGYIKELGGHVPLRNARLETSVPGLYIAGDLTGIEEASAAMVEGRLAGLEAAASLGFMTDQTPAERQDCLDQLEPLRAGPAGDKIRSGLLKALIDDNHLEEVKDAG